MTNKFKTKEFKSKNTSPNRQQRRHSDTGQNKNHVSKNMSIIVYPKELPKELQCKFPETNVLYTRRLAKYLGDIMDLQPCYKCYACVHEDEVYSYSDYFNCRERVLAVKTAYISGDKNLNFLLYTANEPTLISDEAKLDALRLSDDKFCEKYCRVKYEWILEKRKKTHIHFVFHYDHTVSFRFNVFTCAKKLESAFNCNCKSIPGILKPIIPFGDINNAVRYLVHLDDPTKKQYPVSDIICIGCNDAQERVNKGAPPYEMGNLCIALRKFAAHHNIQDYADLLECLLGMEEFNLYIFAASTKGRYYACKAVDSVESKAHEQSENNRHAEIIKIAAELCQHLKSLTRSTMDLQTNYPNRNASVDNDAFENGFEQEKFNTH